jgi:hypothetical protein
MQLPPERAGLYLRALRAGLEALAPHGDYVPLAELLTAIEALDPACSGPLLLPAELCADAGLPALPWLSRARAEADQARRGTDEADPHSDDIERAYVLDRALGARLEARRRLHRLLRRHVLPPASRLQAVLKRFDGSPHYELLYDHTGPDGCWQRVRVEVAGPRAWADGGALDVSRRHGPVKVHPGLRHLLARHAPTPLVALHAQLADVLGGRLVRLARSAVGPFWFPGVRLPAGIPDQISAGLTLQVSSEVVGEEVRTSKHLDPWRPPPDGELVPRGSRIYRERRFCASPALLPVLQDWSHQRGVPVLAVPLSPRPTVRRRTL